MVVDYIILPLPVSVLVSVLQDKSALKAGENATAEHQPPQPHNPDTIAVGIQDMVHVRERAQKMNPALKYKHMSVLAVPQPHYQTTTATGVGKLRGVLEDAGRGRSVSQMAHYLVAVSPNFRQQPLYRQQRMFKPLQRSPYSYHLPRFNTFPQSAT
jgi:hypothetical protein